MAKIWINPAFAKKEIKPEKDIDIASKPSSVISGPQKKSRAFIQNLIDTKSYVTIFFHDGSSLKGLIKWFDNQSLSMIINDKESIFDSKNIIYYRS